MHPGTSSLLLVVAHLSFVVALAWLNGLLPALGTQDTPGPAGRNPLVSRAMHIARPPVEFLSQGDLARFERHIADAASRFRVDPTLIKAVILAESGGDPLAMSPRNARGLMQVLPSTGRELGVRRAGELFQPRTNIFLGTKYLSRLLAEFNGDVGRALAAYNAGPGVVYEGRLLPAETRAYVPRVLSLWAGLRNSRQPGVS